MDFQLKLNDPRLGHYDEIGALVRPTQMIDGKPYEANHCSHFNVNHDGAQYVVAIPVWFTDVYTVSIEAAPAPKPVKPAKVANDGQ